MSVIAYRVLRYSFAVLFLWFGWQQLTDPGAWVSFLPTWTGYFPVPGEMLVQWNGWLEVVLAVMMLGGFWTKAASAFLSLHLLGIAVVAGGAIGMRDAVLAMIGAALALSPVDSWTIDAKI